MPDRVRLGLLGCGTVGSAVLRALQDDGRLAARYAVAGVAVRDPSRPRACRLDGELVTTSPLAVATAADVDVVIEVLGGHDPARRCVEAALASGKPVVTANKALLASDGADLLACADSHGLPLRFEAAVAGAVPVVRTLAHLARSETFVRLDAVLNGTTTFVLATMAERGVGLAEAVAEAQARGYAEADPARDLDGRDAADKLTVLARVLWGVSLRPSDVCRIGLTGLTAADVAAARAAGEAWQVVASATPACARVELIRLPSDHPLARLDGTDNAVRVQTERAGALTFAGPGAGGEATAAAVLADLDDITSLQATRTTTRAEQVGR